VVGVQIGFGGPSLVNTNVNTAVNVGAGIGNNANQSVLGIQQRR
jgi:hypothetical protein